MQQGPLFLLLMKVLGLMAVVVFLLLIRTTG